MIHPEAVNDYHKVTKNDCLSVATDIEKMRLANITDIELLKELADRWGNKNGYKITYYIGNNCWDSFRILTEEEGIDLRRRLGG